MIDSGDPNEIIITLDAEFAIPAGSPICTYCRHNRPLDGRACAAFPAEDSIPMEIWQGDFDHRQPHPGDHGIQFAPENAHCAAEVAKHFAASVPA
jgi:hypothetical protein